MRTYGVKQNFDLLKAFGYIERIVKSDLFPEITYFNVRNMPRVTILYKYHGTNYDGSQSERICIEFSSN